MPKSQAACIGDAIRSCAEGDLGAATDTIARLLASDLRKQARAKGKKPRERDIRKHAIQEALAFIRLHFLCEAVFGNRDSAEAWFATRSHVLGGTPMQLIESLDGIARVSAHLETMRVLH